MDQQKPSSSSIADRKTIERNRRNLMKALYCNLGSLIPHQSSRDIVCLADQLEGAASYIKELQARLEAAKRKKNLLMMRKSANFSSSMSCDSTRGGLNLPRIDIRVNSSYLEVVLITGPNHQFTFTETVRILHEEGADVVAAGFSAVDHTVFHTIHSKIGGSGMENEAARISERLRKFMIGDN